MQSYLKKANKKLVEDPASKDENEPEAPVEHKTATPKSQNKAKTGGGAIHNAPATQKKGTRKKV